MKMTYNDKQTKKGFYCNTPSKSFEVVDGERIYHTEAFVRSQDTKYSISTSDGSVTRPQRRNGDKQNTLKQLNIKKQSYTPKTEKVSVKSNLEILALAKATRIQSDNHMGFERSKKREATLILVDDEREQYLETSLDSSISSSREVFKGDIWINLKQEKESKKLVKVLGILGDKALYIYNNDQNFLNNKTCCLSRISVEDKFARQNEAEKVDGEMLYSFSLYNNYSLLPEVFYHQELSVIETWINLIRYEANYRNFFDYYTIDKEIFQNSKSRLCLISFNPNKTTTSKSGSERLVVKIIKKFVNEISIYPLIANEVSNLYELSKTCHQNVVELVDYFENSTFSFIVMKYFESVTLDTLLRSEVLREEDIKLIFLQIAQALKHLHDLGIVYKALKFENVLVSKTCSKSCFSVKLAGFGSSIKMNNVIFKEEEEENDGEIDESQEERNLQLTFKKLKKALKHVDYKKLERIHGANNFNTDVFNYGALLYQMVYKHNPFTSKEKSFLFLDSLSRVDFVPKYPEIAKEFSHEVLELIRMCLLSTEKTTTRDILSSKWFPDV